MHPRLSSRYPRSRPRLWFVDPDHRAGVNLRGVQHQALSPPSAHGSRRIVQDGLVSHNRGNYRSLPFFLRGSTRRGWSFSSPQLPLSALLVWLIRSCHLFPLSLLAAGLIGSSWTNEFDKTCSPRRSSLEILIHRLKRMNYLLKVIACFVSPEREMWITAGINNEINGGRKSDGK